MPKSKFVSSHFIKPKKAIVVHGAEQHLLICRQDVINIGLEDKFIEHGKVDVLMSENNLDADKITSCILKRIKLL